MLLSRRALMRMSVALGIANLPLPALASPRRVRRNIFSLTGRNDDLAAYIQAIGIMRSRPDDWSLRKQGNLHSSYGKHGSWLFFPWHRIDLLCFEAIIARLTGHSEFALPYWDYQENGFLPKNFYDPNYPLFYPGRAASTVNLAQQRWRDTRSADLLRDTFDMFVGTAGAAGRPEAFGHNLVHNAIGGDMTDLDRAPLDPIFYLHHCNVDRVWMTWQARHPNVPGPPAWRNTTLQGFFSGDGRMHTGTVASVVDPASLSYEYDALYPRQLFNVPDTPPPGMTRRETVAERSFRGAGKRRRNSPDLEARLPAEALAMMRADSEGMMKIEGTGTIAYDSANLAGKVVKVDAKTADAGTLRPVPITASTALLHLSGGGHHSMHHERVAHRFSFGDDITNLVGRSQGGIVLASSTERFDGGADSAPARAVALDYELKLTTTRWVA